MLLFRDCSSAALNGDIEKSLARKNKTLRGLPSPTEPGGVVSRVRPPLLLLAFGKMPAERVAPSRDVSHESFDISRSQEKTKITE